MAKQVKSTNDVIDISLSSIRKKRFRIDGDNNRILELNTSDLNILPRLKEAYPKLQKLTEDAMKEWPDVSEEELQNSSAIDSPIMDKVSDILVRIDSEMRKLLDYIFDTNVSEVCAPSGSMYDPINGQFRYEHIIEALAPLYETDISSSVAQMRSRVKKHTDKYTGK